MFYGSKIKIIDNLRTESASRYKDTIREFLIIVRSGPTSLILNSLLLQPLSNMVHYEGLKDVFKNCCILLYSNDMTSGPSACVNGSPCTR
jgi:hypothetical protein